MNYNEDFEHERLREEAIIIYQKRDEVEQAWKEHEEKKSRKPAKIKIDVKRKHQIQSDTLPF